MDFRIKQREVIDKLLEKMQRVFEDNALVINQISASMDEANEYRKETSEKSEVFPDL